MIDLCAGTGAFSYVFNKYNIKCIFANDNDINSKKIYDINHKNKLICKDIEKINIENIGKHEILCAGFPCQPFSIAGKQLGFDDKRSNVFWNILKIIKFYKPKIIILENVKNLQSHNKGDTFKIIYKKIKKLNYNIKYKILNTSKITKIPHNRERIFIIGFLDIEMYKKFDLNFPKKKNKKIKKFLEHNIDDKYYYTKKYKIYDNIKKKITKHINYNTIYQYRRYYIRENKNNVCPTLTANMGTGGHNIPLLLDDKGIRKLTPRECFNLQGFPKSYNLPNISDNKLYKLVGNAISIPVIKLIIKKIIQLMK